MARRCVFPPVAHEPRTEYRADGEPKEEGHENTAISQKETRKNALRRWDERTSGSPSPIAPFSIQNKRGVAWMGWGETKGTYLGLDVFDALYGHPLAAPVTPRLAHGRALVLARVRGAPSCGTRLAARRVVSSSVRCLSTGREGESQCKKREGGRKGVPW
ncbi:hypothetical protein EW146_g5619 [Bondarzewia mesenterica]|uniref:Uncharacterized protein n=1 Tax=Bondarzewia mesenterica TaxID=1095465 RepID=A0A4S4LQX3_9AGAM|nr:hypothetical protein EW146_g5619 [Bondarzewia mesenterica]